MQSWLFFSAFSFMSILPDFGFPLDGQCHLLSSVKPAYRYPCMQSEWTMVMNDSYSQWSVWNDCALSSVLPVVHICIDKNQQSTYTVQIAATSHYSHIYTVCVWAGECVVCVCVQVWYRKAVLWPDGGD